MNKKLKDFSIAPVTAGVFVCLGNVLCLGNFAPQ